MYGELRASLALMSVRDAYRTYSRVLRLATDQKTDFDTLHLGSLFAKVDYLTREYHLDRRIAHCVNDTRVRLRRLMAFTDDELEDCRRYDLRSICLLISVLYAEPVPGDLQQLFPADERRVAESEVVSDYFRLYVSRWDESHVYGTCEELPDDEEVSVCLKKDDKSTGRTVIDHSYLMRYLAKGVQINVIHPRLEDGEYLPELLVLDPDYLVDITAVTQCFEDYAHDAKVNLLAKMRPVEDTEATLLGNLAGQLLDEEVHSGNMAQSYGESYTHFVRDNAFKVLTTPLKTMREDGELQKNNIHRALHEGLQQRVGRYDRTRVVLEPSFVCEMLGLQGRMDFLQLDGRVLIEQKSGKGEWVPGARLDMPPRQKLQHYVQVLLYQAILHYNHGMRNSDIQLLLLYSRYANGLIGVTPAPALLHEAIRLRNQIAGNESMLCRGAMNILERLTPEHMLQLQVRESFWLQYKRPTLQQVLDPIQKATPLERAYFLRFMTFLANEHMLSKVGTRTKESSGFAAKWHDSLEEKYQTGNIYDSLTLMSPGADHSGSVHEMVFAFAPDRASEMSNFRHGDIVIAYQYPVGEQPDVRRAVVIRGTIVDIGANTLRMQLRAPQSDKRVFAAPFKGEQGGLWAIEHDFMEATYKAQYSGMHALLSAPKSRRDLLLMQRKPEANRSLSLRGQYGNFGELALHVKQAQDFFLIIGPPGTGKTSYGMLYTLQEQLHEEGSQVLITSFTNRAVDEICGKLVEEGIDFVRLGNPLSSQPEYRPYALSERLAVATTRQEMLDLVMKTRVVVGTTTTLSSSLPLFRLKQFDLAIIDEASQILEPHLMGLLSAQHDGQPAIRKFVMIGDHKQLPAVVQQRPEVSRVDDARLNAIGLTDCRLSLFERLLTHYRHDPEVVYMLTKQGRMHRDIADWPNRMFYGGHLQVVPLEHQTEEGEGRVRFIHVPVEEPVVADKVNVAEAREIARQVCDIYINERANFDAQKTVGVIVPYRNQIAAVRNAIVQWIDAHSASAANNHADQVMTAEDAALMKQQLHDITIDTVERYQGSQRDWILYGFTVQRPYQLNFLTNNTFEEDGMLIDRKLNVAMTRARKQLVMLGDRGVLCRNELFRQLIDYCEGLQSKGHEPAR